MIVLNITKPTSQNILYSCDFFKVNNPFVTVDIFKERDYEISDSTLFQQLEKENVNFYQTIKSENEEDLYQIAYEILKEHFSSLHLKWVVIFYNGRYSDKRTHIFNNQNYDKI